MIVKNNIIEKIFHWSTDNKKVNLISKIVCVLLAIAAIIRWMIFFFGKAIEPTKSWRFNAYFVIITVALLFPIGYMLYYIVKNKQFKYDGLFLVLSICGCIVFQLAMPPLSGPDENAHFYSAYDAGNVFLGLSKNWDDSVIEMRKTDAQFWEYDVNFPAVYEMIADGQWFRANEDQATLFDADMPHIDWFRYITSGLGLALARLLNLGFVGLFFMGRFFNSIFFILCGFFAIKISPYGKAQICSLALVPLIMELASCYSYDINGIAASILLAAIILRMGETEANVSVIDLIAFGGCMIFIVPNKAVYVTFALMLFMVPFKKYKEIVLKKNVFNAIALVICLIAAYLIYKYFFFDILRGAYWKVTTLYSGHLVEQDGAGVAYDWWYIKDNPGVVLHLVASTFYHHGWADFLRMWGENPMHHRILMHVPKLIVVLSIICSFAMLVFNREGGGIKRWKHIVWIVISVLTLIVIVLGCLVRFTMIGGARVEISARYYLPIFIIGMIVTGSKAKENPWTLKLLLCQYLCLIPYLTYIMKFLVGKF